MAEKLVLHSFSVPLAQVFGSGAPQSCRDWCELAAGSPRKEARVSGKHRLRRDVGNWLVILRRLTWTQEEDFNFAKGSCKEGNSLLHAQKEVVVDFLLCKRWIQSVNFRGK